MTETILSVAGVGKRYVTYSSNLGRFANWFGASTKPTSETWVLQDIDFALARGQSLALIGENGAGKSTLLKIITGTVRPSVGSVSLNGRVSAILELGLGFNPEFTGRNNIYQAGGLMGFSHEQLSQLMPEIEAFAELDDYFDQPLRVYSSGMQARLAFSLATAVRPDVLIVDEVLSVGDSYFQHKSFDKIRQFKEQGTAILFVSHGMSDVRALCDRVLLIEKGRVLKDGEPDVVIDYYNAMIAEKENSRLTIEQRRTEKGWSYTRSGTFEIMAETLELVDATTREPVATARVGQELIVRLVARAESDLHQLVLGFMLRDRAGQIVWGSNTWHTNQVASNMLNGETIQYELKFTCRLGPGSYSFTPALTGTDTHLVANYEWQDNALVFDVINIDQPFLTGTNALDYSFAIERTGP